MAAPGKRSLAFRRHWPGLQVAEAPAAGVDADLPDADIVIATWWETAEWVNALSPAKGRKVYFIQHHEVFSYLPVERSRATYRLPLHKIVISRWLKDLMEQPIRRPVSRPHTE